MRIGRRTRVSPFCDDATLSPPKAGAGKTVPQCLETRDVQKIQGRDIKQRRDDVGPAHLVPVKDDHHGEEYECRWQDTVGAANIEVPQTDRRAELVLLEQQSGNQVAGNYKKDMNA